MATPKQHVEKVQEMVASLMKLPSVSEALINDYGRHSNFDVWIYKAPAVVNGKRTNGSYRPAIQAMKRFCNANGMIYRGHFLPHPNDHHQQLSVDIDFIPYDVFTNTFEGVDPEGDLADNMMRFMY